jgi:glucose/arabinose dehydrogenase
MHLSGTLKNRARCSHARPAVEALEDRLLLSGGPLVVGGDPRVHPADFRITTFASGLDFPYGMVRLADGSLLVATNPSASGTFYQSSGQLIRLVDADGDGVADGPGTVLYAGLPGALSSPRQAGNLFFVTTSAPGSERIAVLRAGATPADPLTLVGNLFFAFPAGWEHTTFENAVRPTPGRPGDYDLFFNVGASGNADSLTTPIAVSGLASGAVNVDSIYKVTVHDAGGTPVLSGLTQVAAGLRNAAGMAFQPGSGNLYLEDNGSDGGNPEEELGADELNVVAAGDIGRTVPDFGFPNTYIDYFTGRQVGSGGTQPLVAFLPIPVPATGAELAGAAQITFAPRDFPAGLNDGVFVGFHGDFNNGGPANDENPLVYVDLKTKRYFEFVAGSLPGVGHLDALLATNDSLFVADLSSTGSLFGSQHSGVIYQIKVVSRPPVVIAVSGPDDGVTGQTLAFAGTFTDPDPQATHTAVFDWGDHTSSPGTLTEPAGSAPGTVSGSHVYTAYGTYTVTLKVTNGAGLAGTSSRQVTILPVDVEPDPLVPGQKALFVGGTAGNDVIFVTAGPGLSGLGVQLITPTSAIRQAVGGPFRRLVVYGGDGNDLIEVAANVTVPSFLFGGGGNDLIVAGGGPSVLAGGAGQDVLIGGRGGDVLIGGRGGGDTLLSVYGNDLLVAGATTFDADVRALDAVLREWTRSDVGYDQKQADLAGTGGPGFASRLNGDVFLTAAGPDATVQSNGGGNTLLAARGRNWYFARLGGPGKKDTLLGNRPDEVITPI